MCPYLYWTLCCFQNALIVYCTSIIKQLAFSFSTFKVYPIDIQIWLIHNCYTSPLTRPFIFVCPYWLAIPPPLSQFSPNFQYHNNSPSTYLLVQVWASTFSEMEFLGHRVWPCFLLRARVIRGGSLHKLYNCLTIVLYTWNEYKVK